MKKWVVAIVGLCIISALSLLQVRNRFVSPNTPPSMRRVSNESITIESTTTNTSKSIAKEKPMAYVTMVFDDKSTIGAIVMASALKYVNAQYPLVILVTERVSEQNRNKFKCLGAEVIEVGIVRVPPHVRLQIDWWVPSFTKLQIWSLSQYSKLVWIDGDSIVMKNIDELFSRPELTAAQDYNGNIILPNKICGGLMVIEPSIENYDGIMKLLYSDLNHSWSNGEQQLVDYYYKQKHQVNILDSTWSTFVNTMCPSTDVQRVGHFTHWGVSIERPMDRSEAMRHGNCDREYYLRWVDMYEESEKKLKECVL